MISVVIPALDAEAHIAPTLAALVPAAVDGLVREVVLADGGSTDRTCLIADDAGVVIVTGVRGRGPQLIAGAASARSPWLLFLHADTVLEPRWADEAAEHIRDIETGRRDDTAAAFRFALDDRGIAPRTLEGLVAFRSRVLKLPYGDQGLLISRRLYEAVGGYRPLAIMEDIDLVRRLGRKRIVQLDARATTSAERYRREGYVRRIVRNQRCLAMHLAGVSADRIARVYGAS
jgi:rSAM/selenodomain-associated transferase 2